MFSAHLKLCMNGNTKCDMMAVQILCIHINFEV